MMDDLHTGQNGVVNAERLGRLFDRHGAALALFASQWCDCAEDVVQESLIELARQRSAPDDAVAWLYRVVRNRAIDRGRSARRRRQHETAAAESRPGWSPKATSELLDPAEALSALGSLPEEQREVVVARVWGGLTFEQIGRLVGASDSAAHRRYEKALFTLRGRLGIPWQKND